MPATKQALSSGVQVSLRESLEVGLAALLQRGEIGADDIQRFRGLESGLLQWLEELELAQLTTAMDLSWGKQDFIDDAQLRIGLLHIETGKAVPPHDHPGSSGLSIVVEGQLHVREYDSNTTAKRTVALTVRNEQVIDQGGFACYGPEVGNIHHIQAVADSCLVLGLIFNPYREAQRSWFLPRDEAFANLDKFNAVRMQRPV
jgi:hypothetical protein